MSAESTRTLKCRNTWRHWSFGRSGATWTHLPGGTNFFRRPKAFPQVRMTRWSWMATLAVTEFREYATRVWEEAFVKTGGKEVVGDLGSFMGDHRMLSEEEAGQRSDRRFPRLGDVVRTGSPGAKPMTWSTVSQFGMPWIPGSSEEGQREMLRQAGAGVAGRDVPVEKGAGGFWLAVGSREWVKESHGTVERYEAHERVKKLKGLMMIWWMARGATPLRED